MRSRKRLSSSLPLELVPSPERVRELVERFGLGEIQERPDRPGSYRVWHGERRRWFGIHGGAAGKRELELARQIILEQMARAEAANDLRAVRQLEELAGLRSTRPTAPEAATGTRPKLDEALGEPNAEGLYEHHHPGGFVGHENTLTRR